MAIEIEAQFVGELPAAEGPFRLAVFNDIVFIAAENGPARHVYRDHKAGKYVLGLLADHVWVTERG